MCNYQKLEYGCHNNVYFCHGEDTGLIFCPFYVALVWHTEWQPRSCLHGSRLPLHFRAIACWREFARAAGLRGNE